MSYILPGEISISSNFAAISLRFMRSNRFKVFRLKIIFGGKIREIAKYAEKIHMVNGISENLLDCVLHICDDWTRECLVCAEYHSIFSIFQPLAIQFRNDVQLPKSLSEIVFIILKAKFIRSVRLRTVQTYRFSHTPTATRTWLCERNIHAIHATEAHAHCAHTHSRASTVRTEQRNEHIRATTIHAPICERAHT